MYVEDDIPKPPWKKISTYEHEEKIERNKNEMHGNCFFFTEYIHYHTRVTVLHNINISMYKIIKRK